MMKPRTKKNNQIRNICIAIAIAFVLLVPPNLFGYLAYNGQAINRRNFIQWAARDIVYDIESNAELLELPKHGEIQVSGRADLYGNHSVTAYTASGDEVYLRQTPDNNSELTMHWIANIKDGKAQEVWLSKHMLSPEELHPYTPQMQFDVMHFEPFPLPMKFVNDLALVGYWEITDTEKT